MDGLARSSGKGKTSTPLKNEAVKDPAVLVTPIGANQRKIGINGSMFFKRQFKRQCPSK